MGEHLYSIESNNLGIGTFVFVVTQFFGFDIYLLTKQCYCPIHSVVSW